MTTFEEEMARQVADATTGFQHREIPTDTITLREDQGDGDNRAGFTGIAVPFDEETEIWPGLRESVAPGAITADDRRLYYRHRDPVGSYSARDLETGWEITAKISDTTTGRDAATLIRDAAADGVPWGLSIGFSPIKWETTIDADGTTHIRHTSIRVREVSITPNPAYDLAEITETREKDRMTDTTTPPPAPADLPTTDALARELADLRRSLATIEVREAEPTDRRSAGELLAAAARGDATAVETLNRAYTGGTTADDFGLNTWVGDLTRLIDEADPLDGVFAESPLPPTGMNLEHGVMKSNTLTAAKQAKEGDTIPVGKLAVTTATTPVETWAGGTQLTIQEIKRSHAPLLDMHLRALAIETGKARAASRNAALAATAAANAAADGKHVTLGTGATWRAWIPAIVAAVNHMRRLGVALNGLLLPEADWVEMAEWADANDRPILTPSTVAADVGTFSAVNLDGTLLQIPTRMVSGPLATPVFFNRGALRTYTDPATKLTDTEVFTLSEDVAVYQFGAIATEIPDAIIPVTAPAAG